MDVLHTIVQNSALFGMPRWYKITSLALFAIIFFLAMVSLYFLMNENWLHPVQFGY